MSNIYIQEPPTNGKVLMKTTLGDIDIELWSKEAPKACRNFVQLCMEDYYDETIFHRVVKGFIAQGGDPTGTGTGGESIYGKPFKDEFHQRLKFNRRGLVAMANAGANDNGSQFFFTLDRADELQKKHTIFGKVTGNTIYNMVRFNDLEILDDERPASPPKIIKTEILSNPFDDIVPRERNKKKENKDGGPIGKIKSKSKATKNYKLLSFGEEAEEEEEEGDKDARIKSSHDVLNEKKLSTKLAVEENEHEQQENDDVADAIRKKLKKKDEERRKKEEEQQIQSDAEDHEESEKMKRRKALKEEARELKKALKSKTPAFSEDSANDNKQNKKRKEPVNDLMKQLAEEREMFKKKKKDERLLKKGSDREAQTLALLANFETELVSLTEDSEDKGDEDNWMTHKLEFEVDSALSGAKDANMKGDDWYDIYDPRNPMNKRRRDKKEGGKAASSKRSDR